MAVRWNVQVTVEVAACFVSFEPLNPGTVTNVFPLRLNRNTPPDTVAAIMEIEKNYWSNGRYTDINAPAPEIVSVVGWWGFEGHNRNRVRKVCFKTEL